MNKVAREWLRKAERDFKVAQKLIDGWEAGCGDAVCFHCQQAVEKYFKARLADSAISFPRTHDLAGLLALLLPSDPSWRTFGPACQILTRYAVDVRYPGDDASKREAVEAVRLATSIRKTIRAAFKLKP